MAGLLLYKRSLDPKPRHAGVMTIRPKIKNCKQAFTIVEALVATCLLTICMATVFMGISTGFATIQAARENLRATQLLLEKFEAVRLMTYDQLWSASVTNYTTNAYYDIQTTNGVRYTLTVNVSSNLPVTTYRADLSLVTMTVSWTNGSIGRQKTMSSYAAKSGLQQYVYDKHN